MTPAATSRRKEPVPPFTLTPTDEEMLLACARYQYMTVNHWCRYFEDSKKAIYLQRRSKQLVEHDYLIRLYITPLGGRGKGRNIFTHGTAGRAVVKSLGKRVPNRFRPSDMKKISYSHLAHSEAITDVLLSVDLLAKHHDGITVTEMLHERFLTEQRFKVPVRFTHPVTGEIREEPAEVIPDAFVKVAAMVGTGRRIFPIMVECDRDTEEQLDFRTKIARLHAFGTSEKYRELYQARRFNVAFFIQAPRRDPIDRLTEVLAWTGRELTQRNLEPAASSFSFCALDPETTAPEDLLLGPNWYPPAQHEPPCPY